MNQRDSGGWPESATGEQLGVSGQRWSSVVSPGGSQLIGTVSESESCPESRVEDFEDRIRETYRRQGLWEEGDEIVVDYHNVTAEVTNCQIADHNPIDFPPVVVDRVIYVNSREVEHSVQLRSSKSVSRRLKYYVCQGLSYKGDQCISVPLGDIMGIRNDETELCLSLSSATDSTLSVVQEVNYRLPLQVPPRTKMEVTILSPTVMVEPTLTADISIMTEPYLGKGPELYVRNGLYVAVKRKGKWSRYRSSLEGAIRPWEQGGFDSGENPNHVVFKCKGSFRCGVGNNILVLQIRYYSLLDDTSTDTAYKTDLMTVSTDGEVSMINHRALVML